MFATTWPRPAQTAARTGIYLHAGMTRGYVAVTPVPESSPPRYALTFTVMSITHSGGTWPTLADAMREAERICPGLQWDQ